MTGWSSVTGTNRSTVCLGWDMANNDLDGPSDAHPRFAVQDSDVGLDAAIIGAGFTLLRLTRTVDFYGPQPELTRMQDDLSAFAS